MVWTSRAKHRTIPRLQAIQATRTSSRTQLWQRIGYRGYASSSGGAVKKSGGDLPWLLGALAVTIPGSIYLLQPSSDKGHGHGHGDGHAADHGAEKHEEGDAGDEEHAEVQDHDQPEAGAEEQGHDQPEAEAAEQEHDQPEAAAAETTSGKSDEEEGKPQTNVDDAPEAKGQGDAWKGHGNEGKSVGPSDREEQGQDEERQADGGGEVEGVNFKGPSKTVEKDGGDTRRHVPDAKGGAKKRIDSNLGKKLGEQDLNQGDRYDKREPAAASMQAGNQNTMSGKQDGLSNTDTKHSIDITKNPEESKKSEGAPETAKVKGPVDPFRKQV